MMVFPSKYISVIMKGVQKVVGLVCTTLQHTQHTDQNVLFAQYLPANAMC